MTRQPFKVLMSYAYFTRRDIGQLLGDVRAAGPTMAFGDSGAHSARTLGITLTLEDYAAWCHRWNDQLILYSNLDVIGAPEATWRNQRALEDVHGLRPLPVFHTGEPWEYLERYIDQGHTYIALGKLLGNPLADLLPWLDKAFRVAGGRAVFHGFGMTTWDVLRRFPFHSVDSSTWSTGSRFGTVMLFDPDRAAWQNFQMRDRAAVLRHRDLIRDHGADPLTLAAWDRIDLPATVRLAATAWRRAETYLRALHGPVPIPPGPLSTYASPPGLHLYLAEANGTKIRDAVGIPRPRKEQP
jgi:hypothetical protein